LRAIPHATAMEFVFVVPRRELFPDRYPQGFVPFGEALPYERFSDALERHGFFVERERAEREPEWKQVIPYSVIVVDGEVLLFQRTARGGEARLHNKLSIGIGGHINPEDLAAAAARRDVTVTGARRELAEELVIQGTTDLSVVGILNDDSNPVGAVHVGLVQVITVAGTVAIRETDLLEGKFVAPATLRERMTHGAEFETWSARLVERLTELLPRFNAATAPRSDDDSVKSRRPAGART
jgi:predicted NUDIX family phosphoesterase